MLRVGTVPYFVARPLDSGLEDEPGVELVRDVPARLVEGLRNGRLDVALVSSIELFRRPGYSYLDGLAVAGRGRVSSVQVFLRAPLESVRTVALDPASRAAAALTRVVWPDRAPAFLEVEEGEDAREAPADAWLRIGDRALVEGLGSGSGDPPPAFHPSEAWARRTGLPFVFAAWIARPGIDLAELAPIFLNARKRGAGNVPTVCKDAAEGLGIPLGIVQRYLLQECLYEPGGDMTRSLHAFRDAATTAGLASAGVSPAAVPLPGWAPRAPAGAP